MKDRYKLYKAEITIESKDQFESDKWKRSERYVEGDQKGNMCVLYFHSYEAYVGGRGQTEIERFCRREVDKVKKESYRVERFRLRIDEVKEARGWKILLQPIKQKVNL